MTDSNEPAAGHDPRIAPFAWRLPEDWIGAAAMAVLATITFANVIARYFTDESFAWTEEISATSVSSSSTTRARRVVAACWRCSPSSHRSSPS